MLWVVLYVPLHSPISSRSRPHLAACLLLSSPPELTLPSFTYPGRITFCPCWMCFTLLQSNGGKLPHLRLFCTRR